MLQEITEASGCQPGRVDITLSLANGNGRQRQAAVTVTDAVARVLPALVLQSLRAFTLVSDVTGGGGAIKICQGMFDARPELFGKLEIACPFYVAHEQHDP